jgi:uncharacterized protein with PIN domain
MTDNTIKVGRFYGMEVIVGKNTKLMRISRKPTAILITRDQKQLENVEYFDSLSSMITNDASCTREINPGLP